MKKDERKWIRARDELIDAVEDLGFPKELGYEAAKNLGSPKAMERMLSYLHNVKPKKIELVVDEFLAIRSEIEAWREKKASEEANERYNELLYCGLLWNCRHRGGKGISFGSLSVRKSAGDFKGVAGTEGEQSLQNLRISGRSEAAVMYDAVLPCGRG